MKKALLALGIVALTLTSCITAKKIPYLENVEEYSTEALQQITSVPEQVISPGDLLDITVMGTDRTAVQPFNRRVVEIGVYGGSTAATEELNYYLVDNSGHIEMPVLGRIFVQGMTKSELESYVSSQIHPKYVHEKPSVTVRFKNFRVSVVGDVARPGSYIAANERINVFEALALAGDLNITARRDNILLVRVNSDGTRSTARLDINDKDFILSPYFYLRQNDVLYVEPNEYKAASSVIVPPTVSLALSITGTAISAASLIMTILTFAK